MGHIDAAGSEPVAVSAIKMALASSVPRRRQRRQGGAQIRSRPDL